MNPELNRERRLERISSKSTLCHRIFTAANKFYEKDASPKASVYISDVQRLIFEEFVEYFTVDRLVMINQIIELELLADSLQEGVDVYQALSEIDCQVSGVEILDDQILKNIMNHSILFEQYV